MNPIQTVDYIRILPELVLGVFGIIVMMADAVLKPGQSRKSLGLISLVGACASIAATFCQIAWMHRDPSFTNPGWFGMVRVDNFAIFFHLLIPAIAAICIMASLEYLDAQNIRSG